MTVNFAKICVISSLHSGVAGTFSGAFSGTFNGAFSGAFSLSRNVGKKL